MSNHLERLRRQHRRLDRIIDTSKSAGKQAQVKLMKQMRLKLKDRIAELQRSREPALR